MCYKYLADYENTGARFLFNVYIPRDDTTTEIDVLMISLSIITKLQVTAGLVRRYAKDIKAVVVRKPKKNVG